ncbi:hypothetical protein [Pseudomonas aeruginosa]|uniref:hypothetical protein n=1 Tax=Pseudomonas aeruginosa TaxID=287 RepID=UPI002359B576|nr:hypothetical protein KK229_07195 [Pseudomonas aeruginosa]
MTKANECTCPSGDGSLRHPCPAHPASVELAGVGAKLTFINGRPAMCGCQVEYSSGGGEYSDVIYVTLCAKHSGSAILDLVATNRIALTPEYEGQWHADLYLDREIPLAMAEGATPAEAVLALMSAERIDPEQESVEQAGGDERAVDGKPRATRCPDCGESDLMPGDLCTCGYETDPAAGYACSECDGSGDGYVGEVCRECDGTGWFVTPEQARAALAQPSGEVVVTKNESGAIVSVTRQDKEGRLLSVIAESQPSPAQAEKAEAERPIVSFEKYMQVMYDRDENAKRLDAALAEVERLRQFERICEGLPQDAIDGGWTVQGIRAHSKQLEEQLKVALARVAELEKQDLVDVPGPDEIHQMAFEEGQPADDGDGYLFSAEEFDLFVQRLLDSCAAHVAQAQHSVPEGYALIPVRETDAMHDAVMALLYKGVARTDTQKLLDAYIAAAPGKEGCDERSRSRPMLRWTHDVVRQAEPARTLRRSAE